MANDKDFLLKNAVEVGGSTKTTLGTVTNDDIDLSTGNYFAHSPSGATTYTISNAATNQSFQLEVTGGTEEVAQNFSTTLYSGTATSEAHTVTNNIDLATDGGLLWVKKRDSNISNTSHQLYDTERGASAGFLSSDSTNAQSTGDLSSFNTDGFTWNASTGLGSDYLGSNYVSWTFKKEPNFFDVVTYTGNGTTQTISHNLGATVGTLIVKKTTGVENWQVYHRSLNVSNQEYLQLNLTSAVSTNGRYLFGDNSSMIAPTSTEFTVGQSAGTNENGATYVAYLFAHDTANDGLIQCGSFVNDLSSVNVEVNLGWKPQWLLIKGASSGSGLGHWYIYDNSRTGQVLSANQTAAESADTSFTLTSNGFTPTTNFGGTLIYVAIRSAADLDLTWPTSIEWAGGVTPPAPATGETDIFTISTDDGGTTYQGFKTADNLS